MIRNLAWLHSYEGGEDYKKTYQMISDAYKTHHVSFSKTLHLHHLVDNMLIPHQAYDWSKDPDSAGAFALFSPGQFSQHYPHLVKPASDSHFHIVGEAASAHHAWIVGALDSSVRGVYMMLQRFGLHDLQKKMIDKFGPVHELDTSTVETQVHLGRLQPEDQPKIVSAF